jgi:hypothetical protein
VTWTNRRPGYRLEVCHDGFLSYFSFNSGLSNKRMNANDELARTWKESVLVQFCLHPQGAEDYDLSCYVHLPSGRFVGRIWDILWRRK